MATLIDPTYSLKKVLEFQNKIKAIDSNTKEILVETARESNKQKRKLLVRRRRIISDIPNFWFRTIMNHVAIAAVVDEYERNCLYFLDDLEVEDFETISSGFQITFFFRRNPFLESTVLTKGFHLGVKDPFSSYTEIKWKEGHNIFDCTVYKKSMMQEEEVESQTTFFTWYQQQTGDPTDDGIAKALRCDIWPNPLRYYMCSISEQEENCNFVTCDALMAVDESQNIVKDEEDNSMVVGKPQNIVKDEQCEENELVVSYQCNFVVKNEEAGKANGINLSEEEGVIEKGGTGNETLRWHKIL